MEHFALLVVVLFVVVCQIMIVQNKNKLVGCDLLSNCIATFSEIDFLFLCYIFGLRTSIIFLAMISNDR